MTVEVSWYATNQRILHYRFIGIWNWGEYFDALIQGREMQKIYAPLPVCTINDFQQTHHLPPDFLEKARTVSLTRPSNNGIDVYVSTDQHFLEIYTILCDLYEDTPARYPRTDTLADALACIEAWFAAYRD